MLFLVAALLVAPPSFAATYVDGIEDLPLMPGLSQAGDATVFDQAQGRIVESAATGTALTESAILDFYGSSLPQLGWQPAGSHRWTRAGESLTVEIETAKSTTKVRFRLAPATP